MMEVAVIVATNKDDRLAEMLESVRRQTHSDFEVLVQDDADKASCRRLVHSRDDYHFPARRQRGSRAAMLATANPDHDRWRQLPSSFSRLRDSYGGAHSRNSSQSDPAAKLSYT
ncbi:glycosyltransferase family A protein [Frigoribacterium sp. Leaf164]|uniref:glycosyltransferase family A protein n=1 Tax=Frigoribacterium sp. Leaf164 TaxID=1736282 RepID=UPI0009EB7592|nr:glycosyltransferase [Frigoribacterium sp. Leaf164]